MLRQKGSSKEICYLSCCWRWRAAGNRDHTAHKEKPDDTNGRAGDKMKQYWTNSDYDSCAKARLLWIQLEKSSRPLQQGDALCFNKQQNTFVSVEICSKMHHYVPRCTFWWRFAPLFMLDYYVFELIYLKIYIFISLLALDFQCSAEDKPRWIISLPQMHVFIFQ